MSGRGELRLDNAVVKLHIEVYGLCSCQCCFIFAVRTLVEDPLASLQISFGKKATEQLLRSCCKAYAPLGVDMWKVHLSQRHCCFCSHLSFSTSLFTQPEITRNRTVYENRPKSLILEYYHEWKQTTFVFERFNERKWLKWDIYGEFQTLWKRLRV